MFSLDYNSDLHGPEMSTALSEALVHLTSLEGLRQVDCTVLIIYNVSMELNE